MCECPHIPTPHTMLSTPNTSRAAMPAQNSRPTRSDTLCALYSYTMVIAEHSHWVKNRTAVISYCSTTTCMRQAKRQARGEVYGGTPPHAPTVVNFPEISDTMRVTTENVHAEPAWRSHTQIQPTC